ncbi:MAG: cupin domain-containing protein [Myxococcales bacterium]|nr:cupin domain-containing protein [Myxococcales bacterium]MCB9523740.1 cupin domain-containing protein [Myxococcales bacterium]
MRTLSLLATLLLGECLLAAPALALSPPLPPKPQVEVLLDQPTAKVVKITLVAGGVLPAHTTPVDATVVALSGEGSVVIDKAVTPLPTHGAVFLPKDIPHAVNASGAGPLVLVVHHLKAPAAKP